MEKRILELLREQIKNEPFANHMGITLRDIGQGYAVMEAKFSEKMKNFNGLIHGGAIFALIDEAFAVASNSHGTIALALNINITFIKPPKADCLLIAEAKEESGSNDTATYHIEVREKDANNDTKIAVCKALVYRKREKLPFLKDDETQ